MASPSLASTLRRSPKSSRSTFSTASVDVCIDRPRKHRRFSVVNFAFLGIIMLIFVVYIGMITLTLYSEKKKPLSSLSAHRMSDPYIAMNPLINNRDNRHKNSVRRGETGGDEGKMTKSKSTVGAVKMQPPDSNTGIRKEETKEFLNKGIMLSNITNVRAPTLIKNITDGKEETKDSSTEEILHLNDNNLKTSVPVQKVFVIPTIPVADAHAEHGHIILEGIKRSKILEETFDVDDPEAVWVVNLLKQSCMGETVPIVQARWDRMASQGRELRPWKIYLLDFADESYKWARDCVQEINDIFSKSARRTRRKYVHFATRQFMRLRHIEHKWSDPEDLPFGYTGKFTNRKGVNRVVNGTTRAVRFGVRTDLVNHIEKVMLERQEVDGDTKDETRLDIVTLPREKDVAHFWNPSSRQRKTASHRQYVSNKLVEFSKQPGNANLTIFADQIGTARRQGRKDVNEEYVEALLEYKIIVVCQRDRHQGHYRLMEALAGGAMVMTDPMDPLPYHIEDKKQVVVYNSIIELKEYIMYYLNHTEERIAIARSGYEIAMTEHRSWHWMERLIFGNWKNINGGN